MADLVVVYGAPFSGKTAAAWAIARAMPGKSAVVSVDALMRGAIAIPGDDARAELDMAHGQLRLLAAYYLKQRYHLVVEGPFLFLREGILHRYESHIDQMLALMRNLILRSIVVHVWASGDVLSARAASAGRGNEAAAAWEVEAAYRVRSGPNVLAFDTWSHSPEQIALAVQAELARGPALGRR